MHTPEELEALGWPLPPEQLREPGFEVEPAPEAVAWLRGMFIDEGAPMFNPRHSHLQTVDLVAMWTNVEYIEGGVQVVGQAEIVNVNGKPWKRADQVDRLCTLHGNIPQARVWLYAPAWFERGFWRACSVGEHELGHYAHKVSKEGRSSTTTSTGPYSPSARTTWRRTSSSWSATASAIARG